MATTTTTSTTTSSDGNMVKNESTAAGHDDDTSGTAASDEPTGPRSLETMLNAAPNVTSNNNNNTITSEDDYMDYDSDYDDDDSKSNYSSSNQNLNPNLAGGAGHQLAGSRLQTGSANKHNKGQSHKDEDRRAHHNVLERRRRDHLKDSFTQLRDSVPSFRSERASRTEILVQAADFIMSRVQKNAQMQAELEALVRENRQLEESNRSKALSASASASATTTTTIRTQSVNDTPQHQHQRAQSDLVVRAQTVAVATAAAAADHAPI